MTVCINITEKKAFLQRLQWANRQKKKEENCKKNSGKKVNDKYDEDALHQQLEF